MSFMAFAPISAASSRLFGPCSMLLEPALKVCWPISEPKMVCTAQTLRLSWPGVAALLHLVEGRGLAQSSSDARQLCVPPGGSFGRFFIVKGQERARNYAKTPISERFVAVHAV